jgi:hypothetical protein
MTPANRKKMVVAHSVRPDAPLHEVETNRALARWLAHILGLKFGGSYDPELHCGHDLYLLPTQTLVGAAAALELGVKGPDDLWGGYVDHDFICTKAISHGLRNKNAHAPQGWSPLFSERVRNVVLDGLSVFSLDDARPAAEHLLYTGPIRLKPIHACAGRGQEVIKSLDQFDAVLARPDAKALFTEGVVLEQDLDDVITHSVGQSFIGDRVLSYCGDQYLTTDGQGEQVYGGSNLLVVQGYYEDLLELALPDDVRLAIQQAQVFDSAADESYPGFYVTASGAAAYWNNPGAWAVPAAPRWPLCRASSTIRGCVRFACLRWKGTSISPCPRTPSRSIAGRRRTVTFYSST